MCGIAGILGSPNDAPTLDDLAPMLTALRHRGPDDEGNAKQPPLVVGMRRLSILDPTPAGHQPMHSRDGRFTLVHNGEIYNFLELAAELAGLGHRFETTTDTEVILAAYAEWGPEAIGRFNGIWAFAIWDSLAATLFLSRDRFGVKPLFLAESGGRLAFASEIKALLTVPWVSRTPNAAVVREFLADNLVDHTDHTFFEAIRRLPAAHNLTVRLDGTRRFERYWGPPALSDDAAIRPARTDAARVDEIRSLLVDAVALELRSDVALGSCLSGGLDSSSIVTLAAGLRDGRLGVASDHARDREKPPQLAFFAEFHDEGIDERRFVDEVVRVTGVGLRTTTPTAADFAASLDAIVCAQDEPFLSTSIVAQYHVMRIAHEAGVKVLLDGQGADETLGGYPHYVPIAVASSVRASGDALALRRVIRSAGGARSVLPRALAHLVLGGRPVPRRFRRDRIPARWLGPALGGLEPLKPRFGALDETPATGTLLARALWRQIASEHLPALLRYEDRNSMAFGIEARVPFLDHRLLEAALLLPDRLKTTPSGERKVALRRAMCDIVPAAILKRRDKVAFQSPERQWLLQAAPSQTPHATELGYLAPRALGDALTDLRLRDSASHRAWRMWSIEEWLARVVDPR
jgi:asparagine synthase (glutamine-hydrolysing)